MRGYYSIGIYHTKNVLNVGGLWRSAHAFSANGIFTIGRRFQREATDTTKAWRSIPMTNWHDFQTFYNHIPFDCRLVGVEITDSAETLVTFKHPERAIYLLGAEDHGLTDEVICKCHDVVSIPTVYCLNVATTGAIVMYDRMTKKP